MFDISLNSPCRAGKRVDDMKYIVVIGDGMADFTLPGLNGRTPLQAAATPALDQMAKRGIMGLVRTVPEGMPPGSDTANLSIMGYDPRRYHSGRSPFEAASMGVEMKPEDISFRCNLVTLSGDEPYSAKTMIDYSAGEITTEEARLLIAAVDEQNSAAAVRFYPGVSYRHLAIWPGGPDEWRLTPPHDIYGQPIAPYLPGGPHGAAILNMMEQSHAILAGHPVNLAREKRGLSVANSIWFWGEGRRPQLLRFNQKYGLKGAVISAVDLVKGIGLYAGLEQIDVAGATGNFHTNYEGKAKAALEALRQGIDFVYLHIAAPDECSHQGDLEKKVKSIEYIDSRVIRILAGGLKQMGEPYALLIMPDHYTPLSLRTHTADPVPFLLYTGGDALHTPGRTYDEAAARETGLLFEEGHTLMDFFLSFKKI